TDPTTPEIYPLSLHERSSDLEADGGPWYWTHLGSVAESPRPRSEWVRLRTALRSLAWPDTARSFQRRQRASGPDLKDGQSDLARSEEHTSELQSRRDLVCRLL